MKQLAHWLKRLLILLLSLMPAACHALVTAPALWRHHTSSAFELMIGMGILCFYIPVYVYYSSRP